MTIELDGASDVERLERLVARVRAMRERAEQHTREEGTEPQEVTP